MSEPVLELEGTWEEVAAHSRELAGRQVRVTVLHENDAKEDPTAPYPPSSQSVLQQAGTQVADNTLQTFESAIVLNGHEQLYTFDVYCSFRFQNTFTENEVVLDPGGDGTEVEPTETAIAILREEIDEFVSEYYGITDLRLECDSENFIGSRTSGEIEGGWNGS